MPNCAPNILAVPRPSKDSTSHTSSSSPFDPLDKNRMTSRKKRDQIREKIKEIVLLSLGAPVVKIEMTDQQLDMCVDKTLKIFEQYAGREYYDYYVFNTVPGKSIYTMPPDVGYVRNVFYKQTPQYAFQSSDLNGAIPLEYFGGTYSSFQGGMIDPVQPMWGKVGDWYLYQGYTQMFSRLSSAIGGWEWVSGYKNIKLYPIPYRAQAVIVHYMQKQKDWDDVEQALWEGALAEAKIVLGRIRSKFTAPPGPGGGLQLDGQQLIQEGREDLKTWKEELLNKFSETFGPTYE